MKKSILSSILAVLYLFLFSLSALAVEFPEEDNYFTSFATKLSPEIITCLSHYFEMREAQFKKRNESVDYTSRMFLGSKAIILEQPNRESFIDEWANELDISVADTRITYTVNNIIGSSHDCIRLCVYEWVMVDYYCNGYNKLETMGFGTSHVIAINKNTNLTTVICDSYDEITGYRVGNEDDLAYLDGLNNNYEYGSFETTDMRGLAGLPANTTYNYINAVNYSSQWCGVSVAGNLNTNNTTGAGYNPSFYYWNPYGGDCANFVSQCLLSGGFQMDETWYASFAPPGTQTPICATTYDQASQAWRGAYALRNYLVNSLGYSENRITSSNSAQTGNLIYYNSEYAQSGTPKHFVIIVGINNNGQVLINGHTYDAYQYPYTVSNTDRYYYTINLR